MKTAAPPAKKKGYRPDGAFVWLSYGALQAIDQRLPETLSATAVYLALQRIACRNQSNIIEGYSIPYFARTANVCVNTVKKRLSDLRRIGLLNIKPHRVRTPDGALINGTSTYILRPFDPGSFIDPPPGSTENDFEEPPILNSRIIDKTSSNEANHICAVSTPPRAMMTPQRPVVRKEAEQKAGKSTDPKIDDVTAFAAKEFPGREDDAVRWLRDIWPHHWDESMNWHEALSYHLLQTQGRR